MDRERGSMAAVLARLDELEARNAHLEAEVAMWRAPAVPTDRSESVDVAPAGTVTAADQLPAGAESSDPGVGRRHLLRTGLAAAGVATAGAVLAGRPAAAATNSNLVLGSNTNTATDPTLLSVTGTGPTYAYGLGVVDNSYPVALSERPALFAYAKGSYFDTGLQVIADNGARGIEVSTAGVGLGLLVKSGVQAIYASAGGAAATIEVHNNGGGMGGLFVADGLGTAAALRTDGPQLSLQTATNGRPDPTTDASLHATGELLEASNGNLWLCVAGGTPGRWRKVGGPEAAGQFHVLAAPVRVYDSRPGTSPSVGPKTPLAANTPRVLDVRVNSSGVPAGATAATVNLLMVNTVAGNANFTIWANGVVRPAANTMVWGGNAGRFSSVAVTALDPTGKCQVQSSVRTDFVLDVVGYYR